MSPRRARAQGAPAVTRGKGPGGSLIIVESNRTVPLVHLVVASRSHDLPALARAITTDRAPPEK